ncbi:antitoxin [Tsukamurella spumae]|uniref:Antitoxin n=1 Tax=Tsukamurella spumae TaxID=44753 RepID=A0A846X0E7_9ACTN|nr:antitoxin [Tsukamurella spumae]NKY18714.1 antitoxin [Tsukamurella spumae]
MALLDKIKELLGKNPDQVNTVIDKAGTAAKSKFAGHDAQIDMATNKIKDVTGGNTPPAGDEPAPGTPPQG